MIDTIIFDFGGVLYDINYFLAIKELAKLSASPYLLNDMNLESILELPSDFEKGIMSSSQFRNYLRQVFFIEASDEMIDKSWNSMLLGLKKEAIPFIKSIKNKYKIALLSNTNEIHYKHFLPETSELLDLIENNFLSFQINRRKPDVEIYDFVCKKLNCNVKNTLFIDDSLVNIYGANLFGLATLHFTEDKRLSDLFHTI